MDDTQGVSRSSSDPAGRSKDPGMTFDELKALHPGWTVNRVGLDLMCQSGPWRFRAEDPDDAHKEILRRENSGMTVEEYGRWLADPGYGVTRNSS